jgi:hypothetical protein
MITAKEIIEAESATLDKLDSNMKLITEFLNDRDAPGVYNFPSLSAKTKNGLLCTTAVGILKGAAKIENNNISIDDTYRTRISLTGITSIYDILVENDSSCALLYITTTINSTEYSAELKNTYEMLKYMKPYHIFKGNKSQIYKNFCPSNIHVYKKIKALKNCKINDIKFNSDGIILGFLKELTAKLKFNEENSNVSLKINSFINEIVENRNMYFVNFIENMDTKLLVTTIKSTITNDRYIPCKNIIKEDWLVSICLMRWLNYNTFKYLMEKIIRKSLSDPDSDLFRDYLHGNILEHLLDDIYVINDIDILKYVSSNNEYFLDILETNNKIVFVNDENIMKYYNYLRDYLPDK